ncbi:MAG TPA: SIR2 family protein [Gemmatimonadales bacterium]
MSKIIFLLGAGASHDAGLPLMAELTTGFREWFNATTANNKDRWLELFNAAVKAVSKDGANPNIEAVLTLLGQISALRNGPAADLVSGWAAPFDGGSGEPDVLATAIRLYIVDRLTKANPKDAEYLYGLLDFQEGDDPLDVFTMNYDRLLESMAARFGVRFTTGFGDVWDPGLFDVEKKWQMRVYKLHGSVDWYRVPGRSIVFQGSKEHYAFPKEQTLEVLLYPAEGKESYAEPYATLMSSFTRALSKAEFCIAIGYSFHDAHIRRTVLDRLATNPKLQLIIVNPAAQDVLYFKRERNDEPSFTDFADRIAGLWSGAKQALDDRMIGYRRREIRNVDQQLKNVVERRSIRDFNDAASSLFDAVERCRSTQLPYKPIPLLTQVTGEFEKAMQLTIRGAVNLLLRSVGAGSDPVFATAGERMPSLIRGSQESEYFGCLVSCWLLGKAFLPAADADKVTEVVRQTLLGRVKGLLILEENRYLCWPDVIDPGLDVAQALAQRAENLASYANELDRWPPVTGLELVGEQVRSNYSALAEGIAALAELYRIMAAAPPRRIELLQLPQLPPLPPVRSFIGINPPAWRQLLVNPLNTTPLGELFAKLEKSKLISTWMGAPVMSGPRDYFLER